jgi:hypothetical protein
MMGLTQKELQGLLHYDPNTGVWTWLKSPWRTAIRPGDIAGNIDSNGRRKIRIAPGHYYSSRLAWLYMMGEWPKDQIDHINRIKDDDRWINLHEASQSQNSFNRDWCEESGKWRGITFHGSQYAVNIGGRYIGLYRFIEEAIVVRDCMLTVMAGNFAQKGI